MGPGPATEAAVGRTVAPGVGTASPANRLLRLRWAAGVGPAPQAMGLLVLRDLDSSPEL